MTKISDDELQALRGHTPGDWRYTDGGIIDTDNAVTDPAEYREIADVYGVMDGDARSPIPTVNEAKANAHLFVAAPSLRLDLIEARAEIERLRAESYEMADSILFTADKNVKLIADRDKLQDHVVEVDTERGYLEDKVSKLAEALRAILSVAHHIGEPRPCYDKAIDEALSALESVTSDKPTVTNHYVDERGATIDCKDATENVVVLTSDKPTPTHWQCSHCEITISLSELSAPAHCPDDGCGGIMSQVEVEG